MMDPSIRAGLDGHVIEAHETIYRTVSDGFFEITPHWARGFSGLQVPVFNIFLPRNPSGLTDETLADTAAFFSSRNVLYAVELVHDSVPEGPDYLHQRRYQSLPPQPAMYLQGIPENVHSNPEVTIERVTTVPSLTAFCTILHSVFDFPLRDMVKLFPVVHLKGNWIRTYLAFLDEQPVGTGMLICTEGVASVWHMCTLDQYRRRGVATTLLHRMLTEAHQDGHHLMMLYSTAHAYQLFSKFGFEIYTQRQWFLPPGIDYED